MIFHIIRNSATYCLFQEIIQNALHNNIGNKFYISSGFFQEGKGGFYSTSALDTHNRSFDNNPNYKTQTITTKGVYNTTWLPEYNAFVNNLRARGYTVFQNISNRHHAKVFLCFMNNKPILEIIGSSNFTSTAYGITHPRKQFNVETDLVLVNDDCLDEEIITNINQKQINNYVMILNYDKQNNKNIEDEMIWIKDNLF